MKSKEVQNRLIDLILVNESAANFYLGAAQSYYEDLMNEVGVPKVFERIHSNNFSGPMTIRSRKVYKLYLKSEKVSSPFLQVVFDGDTQEGPRTLAVAYPVEYESIEEMRKSINR